MMDDINKGVSSTLYKQQKLAAAYKALQHQKNEEGLGCSASKAGIQIYRLSRELV
jgi:hypothetical protein